MYFSISSLDPEHSPTSKWLSHGFSSLESFLILGFLLFGSHASEASCLVSISFGIQAFGISFLFPRTLSLGILFKSFAFGFFGLSLLGFSHPGFFFSHALISGHFTLTPFNLVSINSTCFSTPFGFSCLELSLFALFGLYFGFETSRLLFRTVQTRKFLLAPSEIADVIVDFSESASDSVILLNDAPYPYPSGDPTDDTNGQVMKFFIRQSREKDPSHVPSTLNMKYPKPRLNEVATERYIVMYEYQSKTGNPTHLYLNAKSFTDPVTEMPREGTDEIWEVINLTDDNHPLHVHLAVVSVLEARKLEDVDDFKECMMKKNDVEACNLGEHVTRKKLKVSHHERGWKNVVKIWPGTIARILVRFRPLLIDEKFPFDPTDEPGYVYHCHILDHEDNEMMRPFKMVHLI